MRKNLTWGGGGLLLLLSLALLAGCGSKAKVPCVDQGDCKSGERCGLDNFCTTEAQSCQNTNECSIGEICVGNSCKHIACNDSSACGTKGFYCDKSGGAGVCAEGCDKNDQCEPGWTCDDRSHVCRRQGCIDNNSCAKYEKCDIKPGETIGQCRYNGLCSCDEDPNNPRKPNESLPDYCDRLATGSQLCQLYAAQQKQSGDWSCLFSSANNRYQCVRKAACASNDDCPAHKLCVTVSGSKVCRDGCDPLGGLDRSCENGEICAPNPSQEFNWNTCQVGCNEDTDCPAQQACVDHKCLNTCQDSDSCADGLSCLHASPSSRSKVCIGCTYNSDCTSPAICDLNQLPNDKNRGKCIDPNVCPDDQYGANNSLPGAVLPINAGTSQPLTLPFEANKASALGAPIFCKSYNSTQQEFYKINVPAGQVVVATLKYDAAKGDRLNLTLVDSTGIKRYVSSQEGKGEETIRFGSKSGLTNAFVVVSGFIARSYAPYEISIHLEPTSGTCEADSVTNHTLASTEGTPINLKGQHVCDNADDVYTQQVPANHKITISLKYAHNKSAPLSLTAKKGTTNLPLFKQTTSDPNVDEYIINGETTANDLTYTVKLDADSVGQVDYDMTVLLEKDKCADGTNNSVKEDATVLPTFDPKTFVPLTDTGICSAGTSETDPQFTSCRDKKPVAKLCGEDWYKVEVLPHHSFDFVVCYGGTYTEDSSGQPNVFLYNRDLNQLDKNSVTYSAPSQGQQDQRPKGANRCTGISKKDLPPGEYYIKVSLYNGTLLNYRYSYSMKTTEQCPAVTENNTDKTNAIKIDFDKKEFSKKSSVCDKNQRWYYFDLASRQEVEALLWYTYDSAYPQNLDIEIYKEDGSTLKLVANTSGSAVAGKKSLTQELDQGKYYIVVKGVPSARLPFELLVHRKSDVIAQPWCDDKYELNNDMTHATTLSSDVNEQLTVCQAPVTHGTSTTIETDQDIFKIPYVAGDTITLSVDPGEQKSVRTRLDNQPTNGTQAILSAFANRVINKKTEITKTFNQTGALFLSVSYPSKSGSNRIVVPYQLNYTKKANSTCTSKSGDHHEMSKALQLPSKSQMLYGKSLCETSPNNVDWYKITVPQNKTLFVSTRYNNSDYKFTTTILDDKGQALSTPATMENASNSNNKIQKVAKTTTDKTYLIKVESADGSRGDYALVIQLDGDTLGYANYNCPDVYELNNTSDTAKSTAVGTHDDLFLCQNPEKTSQEVPLVGESDQHDYYQYEVPPESSLKLTLTAKHDDLVGGPTDHQAFNIDILDSNGAKSIAKAAAVFNDDTSKKTATWTIEAPNTKKASDTFKVHVSLKDNSIPIFAKYTLGAQIEYTHPCTRESSDKFQGTQTAATTDISQYDGNRELCEKTQDWGKLPANTTAVHAKVDYSPQFTGPLTIKLLKVTGSGTTEVESVTSTGTSGKLILDKTGLDSSGTYYIEVLSPSNSRAKYKLWLATQQGSSMQTPTLPYCQDQYEYNDIDQNAYAIQKYNATDAVWFLPEATLCGDDEDWYTATLPSGSDYSFIAFGYDGFKDFTVDITYLDSTTQKEATFQATAAGGSSPILSAAIPKFRSQTKFTFKVKATGTHNTKSNSYGLLILANKYIDGTTALTDPNETPSRNDQTYSPTTLTLKDGKQVILAGLDSATDNDYYTYQLPVKKELKISGYTFPSLKPKMLNGNAAPPSKPTPFADGYSSIDIQNSGTSSLTVSTAIAAADTGEKVKLIPYVLVVQEIPKP